MAANATAAAAPTAIRSNDSLSTLSNQISPSSSLSGTPCNSSPASPRNNYGFAQVSRQLRPPRMPLYTPAVLRPTERPNKFGAKRGEPQISSSQHSLSPSSSGDDSVSSSDSSDRLAPVKLMADAPIYSGLHRIITEEWVEERYDDVTGEPTRDHWKPDAHVESCEQALCRSAFSMLNRRHHCRRCGNVFCGSHSLKLVPLDHKALFHPQGNWVRACDSCHMDYKTWEKARGRSRNDSGRGSLASSDSGSGTATPIIPTIRPAESNKDNMVVGSLSRDWNWSTF